MYNRNPQVVIVLLMCAASSRSEEGARGRQQEAKVGESTSFKTSEELCLLASHMHLDWVIRNQLRTVMLSEFAKI